MAKAYLSILLLLFFVPVQAAELVIGIARGQLVRPDNGNHWDHTAQGGWEMYESDYSPMWSIGLRFPVSDRFGLEARFHDWGKYSQFLGYYPDDWVYESGAVKEPCAPACKATRWGYSDSHARGITLTGTHEFPLTKRLGLFTRGGIAYVVNKWKHFQVIGDDPWDRTFDKTWSASTRGFTATAGIGFAYDNVRLEYVYVHDLEHDPTICCAPQQSLQALSLSFVLDGRP